MHSSHSNPNTRFYCIHVKIIFATRLPKLRIIAFNFWKIHLRQLLHGNLRPLTVIVHEPHLI
jgi:hypothetical protein